MSEFDEQEWRSSLWHDVETGIQLPNGSKDYQAIKKFIETVHNFSR